MKCINKKGGCRLLILAALMTLAACSNGELPESGQDGDRPIAFSLSIGEDSQARVATDSSFASSWENGDTVGIYGIKHANGVPTALANSGNYINNATLSRSGSSWSALSPASYYPSGNNQLDFYAYYPWNNSISNINSWTFTVQTDQSKPENYSKSDLLLAKQLNVNRNPSSVALVFSHAMTLIEVEITSNATVKTVVILSNVKPSATVNWATPATGTASGAAVDITMYRVPSTNKFRALVPPQTVALGEKLFTFDKNGDGSSVTMSAALGSALTLVQGKVTKYSVSL